MFAGSIDGYHHNHNVILLDTTYKVTRFEMPCEILQAHLVPLLFTETPMHENKRSTHHMVFPAAYTAREPLIG